MKNRWVFSICTLILATTACGGDTATETVHRNLVGGEVAYERITRITPDDASDGNQFGTSIAIDGRVVAVGAPRRKPGGGVYLFNASGTQRRVIDGEPGSALGQNVAMHDDTLVALAPVEAPGGLLHVYRPGASGGMENVDDLAPADVIDADKFGATLAVHGSTIAVGAPGRGDGGEVLVYRANASKTTWQLSSTLQADRKAFGRALSLDGDRLVVGARDEEAETGTIHLFDRTPEGEWNPTDVIDAPETSVGYEFGASVALDGDRFVAGDAEAEVLFVFEREGDAWTHAATVSPPTEVARFGSSVALAADRIATGTSHAEQHVWIWQLEGGDWVSKRHFGVLPDDPRPNYFGSDVALDGQLVVAAGPDPPIMGNDGITGYRQGWVDLFRPNASPEVASFDSAGLEDRLFALDLQVSDPDGDSIVSEIVRPPEHGEVTGSGVNLNYRGQTDFHGSDQARIAFLDPYGGRTEVGVDITVDPVNDAPKGSGVRVEVQAGEETPVALDAVDPEGDPIRVIIVNKPAHGVIEGESPPLRYTSDPTYHGYDFVKFRLTDGVDESIVYELEIEVVGEDQTDPSDDGAPDDEPEAERRGASGGGCTSTDVPHGWAPFLMFLPGLILHRTRRT